MSTSSIYTIITSKSLETSDRHHIRTNHYQPPTTTNHQPPLITNHHPLLGRFGHGWVEEEVRRARACPFPLRPAALGGRSMERLSNQLSASKLLCIAGGRGQTNAHVASECGIGNMYLVVVGIGDGGWCWLVLVVGGSGSWWLVAGGCLSVVGG